MRTRMLAMAASSAAALIGLTAPAAVAAPAGPTGGNCTWPACGVVYNRSGHVILVMHDASGPNDSDCDDDEAAYLPDGKASDLWTGWIDVDCWSSGIGEPWHRFSSHPIWVY